MAETPAGDAAPGSPSDMDDEMLRRSRMTRKFTQLREEMADGSLKPAGPGPAPAVAGGRDSSPQLDAWLRGHVNAAGPMPEDEAGNDDGEGEEDAYESDEFEEYNDDEESDEEQRETQGPEERQRLTLEGAAALLRAAARGAVAPWQVGGGDGPGDAAAPVSPDRDPPPMAPISQSSPSSSLSSPDHPGGGADPIAPLLAMLAQIRAVRGQTLAAVERLAPHMPEVINIVAGLEEEATELQAAFDQLLQPLPRAEVRRPDRQDPRDPHRMGVAAQLLQPPTDGLDDERGGQDERDYLQAPSEPSVSIDILPSGFRVTERPVEMATANEPAAPTAAAAAAAAPPAAAPPSSAVSTAAALLPGGGQGLLIGGLDIVRDETLRAQCSHVISICTKQEFDLDAHVNPHGFSIPAFGFSFEHVVLELADSPLAGPLVESGQLTSLLQPAFDALDAWVAASREWTVGGRSKRLMVHSVHGRSRPAAVLCAWMMSKGVGKVSLADALTATQACFGQPYAQPNFGFAAQLLEYERSLWAAQRTPGLAAPSICIWEYVGLSEAEWHAELGRSKQHPGMLDRTSARRILAASRRRQRLTDEPEPELETEPVKPGRPSIRIDLDPAALSDTAILSALGGGEAGRTAGGAGPLSTDLPIDAPQDMGTATTATDADLDAAWSREELDAALCGRNDRGDNINNDVIDWAQFTEVD